MLKAPISTAGTNGLMAPRLFKRTRRLGLREVAIDTLRENRAVHG
jgi:hypothetical protein